MDSPNGVRKSRSLPSPRSGAGPRCASETPRGARARQSGTSPTSAAGTPRGRGPQRPNIVVHKDSGNPRSEAAARRRSAGSRGSDRSGSFGSSSGDSEGEEDQRALAAGGSGQQQSFQSALDFLKKTTDTPSYVESGGASEVSSKRSSIQEGRASSDRPYIKEEDEDEDEDSDISEDVTRLVDFGPSLAEIGAEANGTAQSRSSSVGSWQEWRTEFSLDSLDRLSALYCEAPSGLEEGSCIFPGHIVGVGVAEALGVNREVVQDEMEAKGMVAERAILEEEMVAFASFKELLELSRSTMERVEREQDQLLFSREELDHMKAVLSRMGGCDNTVAPAHLFDVMRQFEMNDIDVDDPEMQRQIADAIQGIQLHNRYTKQFQDMSVRPTLSRSKTMSLKGLGALAFEDVVRITGIVIRNMQRERRRVEFERERRTRREAGFSPAEMEDLRELFKTYKTLDLHVLGHPVHTRLRLAVHKSTLARLMALLVICGIEDLEEWESNIIEDAVLKHAPQHEGSSLGFGAFMMCMREVFSHHIGKIEWLSCQERKQGQKKGEDNKCQECTKHLEGRTSFGSVMLLERERREQKRREVAEALARESLKRASLLSQPSSAGCSRRSSTGWSVWASAFDNCVPSSRKSSAGFLDGGKKISRQSSKKILGSRSGSPLESQLPSHPGSRAGSRAGSRHPSRPGSQQRSRPASGKLQVWASGGSSGSAWHPGASQRMVRRSICEGANALPDLKNLARSPQTGSRRGTKHRLTISGPLTLAQRSEAEAHMAASRSLNSPRSGGGADGEEAGGSVLKLKGLPAAEAMLGRKEFRACSLELSEGDVVWLKDSLATPPNLMSSPASRGASREPTSRRNSRSHTLPASSPRRLEPLPGVGAGSGSSREALPAQRKVKQGQDALAVVNDAIAKLAEQRRLEGSDSDEGDGGAP